MQIEDDEIGRVFLVHKQMERLFAISNYGDMHSHRTVLQRLFDEENIGWIVLNEDQLDRIGLWHF